MNYTIEEKYEKIKKEIIKSESKNPVDIVRSIMKEDYINIHGPEHHFLDGACFLAAFNNAGGNIDLNDSLDKLAKRSILMPGAICGAWGICGSVASVGASMSIIHNTSYISSDRYYKDHLAFTSKVLEKMSKIGGPRCCKRNAFISLSEGVKFVKENYNIEMDMNDIKCEFSNLNKECLKEKCPFYNK